MKKLTYIPTLDGLRAIAIIMVIIYHYVFSTVAPELMTLYLRAGTSWLWAGVDLFFVLSGFLIGRILINAQGSENYFKAFYVRRFFRIFPAYYLILILFILLIVSPIAASLPWLTGDFHPIYSYALYIQNVFQAAEGSTGAKWLGITWSLAVEEQFYLILPLVIYYLPKKYIPALCIAGIIAAPVIRYALDELAAYVLLPSRMDSLLIGVFIGWLHLNDRIRIKPEYLIVAIAVLLIVIEGLVVTTTFERIGGVMNHSLLGVFFGCVVVLAINAKGFISSVLTSPSLIQIGKVSYMLYLTHQIFNGVFHGIAKNGAAPSIHGITDVLLTCAALATCLLFCHVSYRYFEGPLIKLGHRHNYDNPMK